MPSLEAISDKSADKARKEALIRSLAEVEKEHIENVLNALNWNKKRTIEALGISRPTLDKKIREYEIHRKGE